MTIQINTKELELADLWIENALWLDVNLIRGIKEKDEGKDGEPYKQIPLQRIIQDGLVTNGLSLNRANKAAKAYVELIDSD